LAASARQTRLKPCNPAWAGLLGNMGRGFFGCVSF